MLYISVLLCTLQWGKRKTSKRFHNKEYDFSDNRTRKYFHFHLTNSSSILALLVFEVTENFYFSPCFFPQMERGCRRRSSSVFEKAQKWEGKTVNDCHQAGKSKTTACATGLVLSPCNLAQGKRQSIFKVAL